MKYELKIHFEDLEQLDSCIEKTYFVWGDRGKISKKRSKLEIEKDSANWIVLSGLSGLTVKVENEQIIDGTMRFTITQKKDEITLTPCSIYCIKEGDKYSFY